MDKAMRSQLRDAVIVTVVPFCIVLLIQKPELRQALVMRLAHYAKEICQAQADFWQQLATTSAQAYNEARM